MPSKSGAEHGYMGMSSTPAGRKKLEAEGKKPVPEAVAKEFLYADKGRHFFHNTPHKGSKKL